MPPKHSPAPWVVHGVTVEDCNKGSLAYIIEADGGMVASRANADLIAAAPDMFEALELLLDLHGAAGMGNGPAARKAAAAIAKARGEAA